MIKRTGLTCSILLIFLLITNTATQAQSYIEYSKFAGGTAVDSAVKMEVVAGETYLLNTTTSANFTVTDGSSYAGKKDIVLSKYSSNGSLIYARYLGGAQDEVCSEMKIVNGEVIIIGITQSANFPVSNGSTYGGETDIFVTKINATGGIAFSTYIGGSKLENLTSTEMQISGNELFLAGSTASENFPVTNGSTYKGGTGDAFILKLNTTNGAIIQSNFLGGNYGDQITGMYLENGMLYLAGNTNSNNLPITIGEYVPGNGRSFYIYKLQANNLQIMYARYLAGTQDDFLSSMKVQNGEVHLIGYTNSTNFPVTNGSTASGLDYDGFDGIYSRLNADGSVGFSTYLSTSGLDILNYLFLQDGYAYIGGISLSTTAGKIENIIYKISNSGQIVYSQKLPVGTNSIIRFPWINVVNGELFLSGTTNAPDFPVTDDSQFHNGGTGFFTHISLSGNIVYSTLLGKMNNMESTQFVNNKFYIIGNTDYASYAVNDSSQLSGGTDNLLIILNDDGSKYYSRYIGGSSNEYASVMQVHNNDIYICGKTNSSDYPVTEAVPYHGAGDAFLTKLSFCPTNYDVVDDILSPATQTVCKYGLANKVTGKRIMVPGSNLPTVYLNGTAGSQRAIDAVYQWQIGSSASGPWTNVAGATLKDYTPVVGGTDLYYRRLSFSSARCGSVLIHTSEITAVIVNTLTAPTVDAGGPFITCPGSPIAIGGSPTASGGNLPYVSYTWDMGADAIANPTVSPAVSTIYSVTVTDAMGCQQMGQAIVFSYAADAGINKSSCANAPVRIGGTPIPGVQPVVYNWLPNTHISDVTAAQPIVNPPISTDYELTLTVTKTGGGTCITKDTVNVLPVAAPTTAEMAGPDKTICLGSTVDIGKAAEPGFNYVWSPGSYLINNINATTTYAPGNLKMPEPNPAFINITAQKDGCSFTDQTIVSVIEARAGQNGCGPRLVGMPDRTPNINENYQWIKISGPGNFTGSTTLPQVPVSASIGGNTDYLLIVSYQGQTCISQVTVPEGCIGCDIQIMVEAKYECPGFDANFGDVTLTAFSTIGDASYSWSPQAGLSNYTSNRVKLTDNVARTYTIRATSLSDPSLFCERTIDVNNPAFSAPVFPAPDVNACANLPVSIGLPPVNGYSYVWEGAGLLNNYVSNPVAIIATQTSYPVKITDGNGCQLKDTVTVFIQNVNVDAGPDWIICSNGIATLGTPALPNTTYQWEPSASPWQNGTNQFSAQPQVLAITDMSFTVTATTSAGCVSTDEVNIVINNSPVIPDAPDVMVCVGKSVVIGSPALPGVSYQWTPTAGLSDATIAQPEASPLSNTTYTLLATFPGSCALPASDQVSVRVSDPSFSMPDISFCPSVASSIQLGNGVPLGMNYYSWTPSSLVSNPFIANPSTLNPPPAVPTDFILLIVNADGCQATDTMKLIPATVKPAAGTDKTICKNTTATIGSSTNVTAPGISYSWGPATNLSDPFSGMPTFTGTTGGTYQYILTKTDNTISCSASDTVLITVIDLLLPQISGPIVCQNSCVQIGVTPVAGIQYQWTPSTGLSNPNIANPIVCVGNTTLNYTLTATNTNGCSSSVNIVVGVQALPAASIDIPILTACVGDINKTFNPVINPVGDYSYLWTPDDGTLSSVTIANPYVLITGAGTKQYNLQVTNNVTGCSNNAVANLVANNCTGLGSVGDFLWFDSNGDGLQTNGELGVSNTLIKLYNSLGFTIASTYTDERGFYSFTNITAGSGYYIVFAKPAGYVFTTQNVGGISSSNNSKADASGRTAPFAIVANENVQYLDAGIIVSGIVPVTLLSFTGQLRSKQVLLNWQTTAEHNNHYFIVEKSKDQQDFVSIGRVAGNGTTSLPHSYNLTDPHPYIGTNYYRLRQVDFDGRFIFSHIVKIDVAESRPVQAVYNAPSNSIKIVFDKKQNKTKINLFAANGQLITTANIQNIATYDLVLPIIPQGIYMLQIVNDQTNETQKIMIHK